MYSSTLQNSVRRPSAVKPRRVLEKLIEPGSLQRADAELGKDFLLAHAVMQGVQNGICSLGLVDWIRRRALQAYRGTALDRLCGKLRLPEALTISRQLYVAVRDRASPRGFSGTVRQTES